jgi:hypothetical protein
MDMTARRGVCLIFEQNAFASARRGLSLAVDETFRADAGYREPIP